MVGSSGQRGARGATGTLMRAIAPVALLVVPVAGWPGPVAAAAAPPPAVCVVAGVADAVTLELRCAGETRVERLRGVRAPRPGAPHAGGEPFAVESRRQALRRLAGARIELADGIARLDGEDVRLGLLARGLAVVEPATVDRAELAELAALRRAEREARSRGLGAWSHAAWRALQASVTEPVPLAAPPPPPAAPPLAVRAARPGQPSWEERKAAFEAALRELERASTPPPRRR